MPVPVPPPEAATRHYARQQHLTAAVLIAARREWARLGVGDFDAAWRTVGPRLLVLVSAAQRAAVLDSSTYLPEVLDELAIDAPARGRVNAGAFVGVASDGRTLDTLLYEPVIQTRQLIAAGATTSSAVAGGRGLLEMIVQTQLADAARAAVGVGIMSRPKVTRYVRMLQTPSCSRCALLAGRVYKTQEPFLRHPRCDCRHIPATEDVADDLTTDPSAYFDSLSAEEQAKHFTQAGAKAIRDGADMGQVVNARRGMYSAGGRTFTRTGTTRRSFAGRRMAEAGDTFQGATTSRYRRTSGRRMMPESIYEKAGDDRAEAIRLLRSNGFLI